MHNIPVFYAEEMLAESDSRSPTAGKPRDVVASWTSAGFPIEFLPVTPVTVDQQRSHRGCARALGVLRHIRKRELLLPSAAARPTVTQNRSLKTVHGKGARPRDRLVVRSQPFLGAGFLAGTETLRSYGSTCLFDQLHNLVRSSCHGSVTRL